MSAADPAVVAALAPTGVLRAAINLGNPVLAHGTPKSPGGVTVDLAHEVGRRLGVPVQTICFDAARHSFEAMRSGAADLCFLAIEPAREGEVAFTPAYTTIDGVYVVPADSSLRSPEDVDRAGVRIGVKRGSAYDLFLTRTLRYAELVRGDEGTSTYLDLGLDAGAGLRGPAEHFARTHDRQRVLAERFMEIRQAVGVPRATPESARAYLGALVGELVTSGFVAASLAR